MLWMAAAVTVIGVSAALLFNQQGENAVLREAVVVTTSEKNVAGTAPMAAVPESGVFVADKDKQLAALSPTGTKQTTTLQVVKTAREIETAPVRRQVKKELIAMQPSGQEQHLVNSRKEVKPVNTGTFIVPDTEPALALTTPREPVMVGLPETTQQDVRMGESTVLPERKGISNVGDLVNFVVDKIDKREEKLLQFNTNDDDQSSLVSINIGIIKLNTKQRAKR